jgi:hypothetical protein
MNFGNDATILFSLCIGIYFLQIILFLSISDVVIIPSVVPPFYKLPI